MRSIVVLVTWMLAASTPAAAETPAEAKILGGMVLTEVHRAPPPDDIAMRAPPSRPEYAGYVFFVPRSDVALAESEGWRALTDAETKAWLKKKFDDAEAEEEERIAAGRIADRWRIATLLLGAVAVATTALAAWLVARRRAAG
jgi:hypothetical protein